MRSAENLDMHAMYELVGNRLTDLALIQIAFGSATANLRASVREPLSPLVTLDRDLQFSQRRYTSIPGKRRKIEVFADPTLVGEEVEISSTGGVAVSATRVLLMADTERGIAVGSFLAESEEPANGVLSAALQDYLDEADIKFEETQSRPKLKFEFDDVENFGPGRRFKWDSQDKSMVRIAAAHPTLSRVLGPSVENWPGQHAPQTRAILAELISEAYVDRRIQQDLPSLGTGPDNSVDPVEYESVRYRYFDECFMLCHTLLTPAYSR